MNDSRQSGFGTIHPMRNRGAASLTVMLVMLPTQVWAAPPPEGPPPTEPASVKRATCEDELVSGDQESGQITRAIELMGQGQERSKSEDYAGAIHFWQQAYDLVTLRHRISLFVPFGRTHWLAYQKDGDQEHLQRAQALLERGIEALGACEEQARREAQEILDGVNAELDRIEAERLQQERDRAAREALAREQVLRQQRELEERKARLEDERRRFGLNVRVGGSAAGLGVVFLATAAAGLGLGANVDRDGARLFVDPDAQPDDFQDLLRKGRAYNRMAIATGALGGALVISGGTVLIVAAVRYRRAKSEAHARLAPGRYGLEVRF